MADISSEVSFCKNEQIASFPLSKDKETLKKDIQDTVTLVIDGGKLDDAIQRLGLSEDQKREIEIVIQVRRKAAEVIVPCKKNRGLILDVKFPEDTANHILAMRDDPENKSNYRLTRKQETVIIGTLLEMTKKQNFCSTGELSALSGYSPATITNCLGQYTSLAFSKWPYFIVQTKKGGFTGFCVVHESLIAQLPFSSK